MNVLNEPSKDAKIKEACKRIGYPNHDDLYQELFIILCELPKDKLNEIYSNGYIHYWVVRTLTNMVSPYGKFYKKYKVTYDDTEADKKLTDTEDEGSGEELERERERAEVESLLTKYENSGRDGFGWYKVTLLKAYAEVGSYRKLSKLTGIHFITIAHDINTFRKELITNLSSGS
jgi:hypothetical protein